jgi:hypothetical protein
MTFSPFLTKTPDYILLARTLAAVSPPRVQLIICNPRHGFRVENFVFHMMITRFMTTISELLTKLFPAKK